MKTVIGIDSSLTISGCARVDLNTAGEPVRWETWRAHTSSEDYSVDAMRRRIRIMMREILTLIPDFVSLSVIEGPSMGSKFAALVDERAGLRWMLIDQLRARGPVVLMPPKTRALLATGNGNAGKPEVLAAIRSDLPHVHVPDHNVADAVALAVAGAHALGMPWGLTAKQKSAHAKVAWPSLTNP